MKPSTKNCPKCHNAIVEGADFCIKCGTRLATKNTCRNCGKDNPEDAVYCLKCGKALSGLLDEVNTTRKESYHVFQPHNTARADAEITSSRSFQDPSPNLAGLSEYYRNEFSEIYRTNESYKGKWNWAAALFGAIWAFTKGLWVAGLLYVIVILLTFAHPVGGLISLAYWIVLGVRGNYMYYTAYVKKRQLPF